MLLSGRSEELRRLARAVAADDVQGVVVTGEAGVGKTTLLRGHLADTSHLVLRGQCVPLATPIAHLPLLGALGTRDREVSRAVDAALAAIPPHLVESLSGVLPRLSGSAEASRSAGELVFVGVGELLAELGMTRPVSLLIEDLHWADQATLDLLTYLMLARNDPGVSVVATFRSGDVESNSSTRAWLDLVRTGPAVVGIELAPLDRAAFDAQLAELSPEIDDAAADRVFALSEGNPFFTEQLVAALENPSTGRIPTRLAGLIGRQLERLTETDRLLMTVLAFAARPLDLTAVAQIAGVGDDAAVQTVRRLLDANLVAMSSRVVRTRHALIREAVLDRSPVLAEEIHGRLGAALEAIDPRELAAEAAVHYRAAGLAVDEFRAAAAAAARAWELAVYGEAADWGLRSFDLLSGLPDLRRPGVGLGLLAWRTYRSLGYAGRSVEEDAFGSRIWTLFSEWPDAGERGLVLTQVSAMETTKHWWSLPKSARRLLEDPSLPTSATHASFLYNVAVAVARQGDLARSRLLLDRSLHMALSIEAWEEAIIATGWQSALDRGRVDAEPVKAVLDRMDRMARHVTTARGLLTHAILASDLLLKAGRLEEARLRARSGWEVARTHGLGSSFSAGLAVSNAVEASCELGDVSGAEALVASFMRARDRPDDQVATSLLAGVTAPIDLLRGRTQPVELDHRLGDEFHREVLEVRVEQLLWHGDPATGHGAAVEGLTRLLRPQTALDRPLGGYLLTLAARAAADLGDVALIEETQAIRSRFVDLGDDPLLARPAVGRIRGDAATWEAELARGRDVDPLDQWRDVARVWEELGYRHRAAYAWWRAAQRSLREPVDRSAAADSLRRGYGLATEHEPLLRAVRELADRLRLAGLGAVDSLPIRDRHESLTQQEQRVLRLVAHGRTNAEIAAELFISPKTASVHVSNILRKLGVGNRAAAAGWAATVGLTDRPIR